MCSFSASVKLDYTDRANGQKNIIFAIGEDIEKEQLNEILKDLEDTQQLGWPKDAIALQRQGGWVMYTVPRSFVTLSFIRYSNGPMDVMNQVHQIASPATKVIRIVHPDQLVVN
jgi:hypothetical protein